MQPGQPAGAGVGVYTRSGMLTAHCYPAFKRHLLHLAGNYGNAITPIGEARSDVEAIMAGR